MLKSRVLVLNQDYQAISICSPERAFVLVYLRKAEMVHLRDDSRIRTVSRSYDYPSIIRLNRFIRVPYRKVSLNRANIFRRDNYQCVYCGSRKDLTLDHVVPRSCGGRDTWENLVAACQSCNTSKGNRTPEQAKMPMMRKPYRPSFIMYLADFTGKIDDEWRPFLMMG
jgi:5-methylcytosine-specific restriction endonuclease McrA